MKRLRKKIGESFRPVLFTLVELLIVIAIIAVLTALLLPGLAAAKSCAQKIACMGNLKTIGSGFGCYLGDYGAVYPPDIYCGPLTTQTVEQPYWDVLIGSEMMLREVDLQNPGVSGVSDREAWRQVFTCSQRRTALGGTSDGWHKGYSTAYGRLMSRYGYNCKLSWGFGSGNMMLNGFRAERLKRPASTFLLLDCVGWGPHGYYWSDYFLTYPTNAIYQGFHSGGKNVMFCDLHVDWFSNFALPNNFSP